MWTGIYGKYPDKTYLTEDDKIILMRSPFFYHENDSPVIDEGPVVARYLYRGGAFERHAGESPILWKEIKSDSDANFTFEECTRNDKYVVLQDKSRGITIRLPVSGGMSSISTDDGKTWSAFYEISRQSDEKR